MRAPAHARKESWLKPTDTWLDVLVLDHVEVPVTKVLARTRVTPTQVTIASIGARVVAAVLFSRGSLTIGAVAFIIGLVLDGVDGKLARATRRFSSRGGTLDLTADYALFVALWVCLGDRLDIPFPILVLGLSGAVGSSLATAITTRAQPSVGSSPATAVRHMVRAPGVLEIHALLFGVLPLFFHGSGQLVPACAFGAATAYFFLAWSLKLARDT